MFILGLLILLINVILAFVIKDKLLTLKVTSMVFFSSGILVMLTGYIFGIIIKNKVNVINISNITNMVFNDFFVNGLVFIGLSIILSIIYIILRYKKSV